MSMFIDEATGQPLPPEAQEVMNLMREQLLIVFVNRMGGKVRVPVKDVDGTGQYMLSMEVDEAAREFVFTTRKKS